MQKIFLPFFVAYCCFASGVLHAASSCIGEQYETESGSCYPAWYGQTTSGAYYTIAKPEGWAEKDGLVIWNHGFQSFLTGFGATDLLSILNPSWAGYYSGEVQAKPGLGPYAETILAQGYAMAASSYSQTGWAVFDSHVSNSELYDRFLSIVTDETLGAPGQFYIIGGSLGGIVTIRDIEADLVPDPDGALILCGAVAGSQNWYDAFDLRMIYEAICDSVPGAGLPQPWYERPELLFGEVEFLDSLDKCTKISSRLLIDENDPTEIFTWELINPDAANRLNEILEKSQIENIYFLGLSLWYAVFQIPRLINDPTQLNGLIPFENIGIDYDGSSVNQAALRTIALPSARDALLANYTPNGNIGSTKIVSIHTSHDGLVRVQNQSALINTLPENQLTIGIVDDSDSPSHCGFSADEGLAAWYELTDWVSGSLQPTPLDLQITCLASATDQDNCNYDPSLTVTDVLPTFSRGNEIGTTGTNSFDNATAELSFQSLKLLGSDTVYSGVLRPPAEGSSLFTLKSLEETGTTSIWLHGTAFDSIQSLLYIPRVKIVNTSPVDPTEYDVYMRLKAEGEVSGLEFIELEVKP
jgi:hypothetical protein